MVLTMSAVVTLIVVGAILLFLEPFLPGLIAGTTGLLCLMAAIVIAYWDFGFSTGNTILVAVLVGLSAGVWFWLKYFPQSRMAQAFVSKNVVGELNVERLELLHQTGVALTGLRPCGTALIGRQRVDVVSEGAFVEPGTPLEVVQIEGLRVVVRAQ